MGGIALLARSLGHQVSGSDANVYPPMSVQLHDAGIVLMEGYAAENIDPGIDMVVVGNALSRGNPEIEHVLNRGLPYTSGPQWLGDNVLMDRWVLAVAGTHGKTTSSSILAWLLEDAGLQPGFLIGGVANNFGISARLGEAPFFVVEADEYDTAFFDKRSKFVHYRPNTLILNNLEFDHADIFPDVAAIQRQFHHLLRVVPGNGKLIVNAEDANLAEVLEQGYWSDIEFFGTGSAADTANCWKLLAADNRGMQISSPGGQNLSGQWSMTGQHNACNALAALAAAVHAGITPDTAMASLARFQGVKRRMEIRGRVAGVTVYDDFAHHPTAIRATLEALESQGSEGRIIAVIELRSNSMRMGAHVDNLLQSFYIADGVLLHCPAGPALESLREKVSAANVQILSSVGSITAWLLDNLRDQDRVVFMSNGGFEGIHDKVLTGLADKFGVDIDRGDEAVNCRP
jgi:UDP-N-acetylmuramate: L-alanyl-gamma-D-glutamyl-meso-diaminopimelate ligase